MKKYTYMYLWRGSLTTKHCRLKPGFLYQNILQSNYEGILNLLQCNTNFFCKLYKKHWHWMHQKNSVSTKSRQFNIKILLLQKSCIFRSLISEKINASTHLSLYNLILFLALNLHLLCAVTRNHILQLLNQFIKGKREALIFTFCGVTLQGKR